MYQDTPLTVKPSDARPSASPTKNIENGEHNQKSPRLSEQFYKADLSMRTERPIPHNFVRSTAFFVLLGNVSGADPLQINLRYLYHLDIDDLERVL